MEESRTDASMSFCAAVLCRDPRLHRLLEMELSLCGVASVAEGEPHGLCLIDLDEYPLDTVYREGLRVLCWSRSPDITLPVHDGVMICLHRPFSLRELEESIRQLLMDTPGEGMTARTPLVRPLPAAVVRLEPAPTEEGILPLPEGGISVRGQDISLTAAEQAIFDCLYTHRGETVTKEALLSLLGGGGNSVEVYVCKLRAKIEKPLGRRMITTVRGVGYRMEECK